MTAPRARYRRTTGRPHIRRETLLSSSTARRLPFEIEDLAAQAEMAAAAVKVEIFGGDAIVTPEEKIFVIDINSWPSFARVRTEASVQIARRLRLRQTSARKA